MAEIKNKIPTEESLKAVSDYHKAAQATANARIDGLETETAALSSGQTTANTRITELAAGQAALNARMDTFATLPSGSTSGDAELLDIRVSADGKTYTDAGGAVRGQYLQLKDDLKGVFGKPVVLDLGTFTAAAIAGASGVDGLANDARARTGFLQSDVPLLFYVDSADYEFLIWTYSAASPSSGVQAVTGGVFVKVPVVITPGGGGNYFRVCFRRVDGENLTTSEDSSSSDYYKIRAAVRISSYTDTTLTEVGIPADAKATGDGLAKTLQYQSTLQSTDDLDELKTFGLYRWTSSNRPIHSPDEGTPITMGIMMFLAPTNTTTTAIQMVINGRGEMWTRSLSSTGWTGWQGTVSHKGTRIAFLGDSIIAGRVGGQPGGSRPTYTIPQRVAAELAVTTENFGVGGMGYISRANHSTIAIEHVQTLDLSGYNYIYMSFGGNDSAAALGNYDDPVNAQTIMGAVHNITQYLMDRYPGTTLILAAPTLFKSGGTFPLWGDGIERGPEGAHWKMPDLREQLRLFAKKYRILFVDQGTVFNSWNVETLIGDNAHPTEAGYQILGKFVAGQIGALI